MGKSRSNSQSFSPKSLEDTEVNNSLVTIWDFPTDSLTKHLKGLVEWREQVIEEGCCTRYERARAIRRREIDPAPERKYDNSEEVVAVLQQQGVALPLIKVNCAFNDTLIPTERFKLNQLVALILAEVPSVQMIVHLGTHPSPYTFYLLIFTDENDKTAEREILNKIEDRCRLLINVYAIVHKSDAIYKAIDGGSQFFTNASKAGKIAYQSAELLLPQAMAINNEDLRSKKEAHWNRWGTQGKQFLNAALHCYKQGDYNLSVFLLHQSVENILSAIIRVNLDYRLASHNVSRMFNLTLMFTDDLKNVFDFSSQQGMQLFDLLQTAYSAARYKDDFNPDKGVVKALADKVCEIVIRAERLYEQAIDCLND